MAGALIAADQRHRLIGGLWGFAHGVDVGFFLWPVSHAPERLGGSDLCYATFWHLGRSLFPARKGKPQTLDGDWHRVHWRDHCAAPWRGAAGPGPGIGAFVHRIFCRSHGADQALVRHRVDHDHCVLSKPVCVAVDPAARRHGVVLAHRLRAADAHQPGPAGHTGLAVLHPGLCPGGCLGYPAPGVCPPALYRPAGLCPVWRNPRPLGVAGCKRDICIHSVCGAP